MAHGRRGCSGRTSGGAEIVVGDLHRERGAERPLAPLLLLALILLARGPAEAGHELTYYPSFYPQEITVRTVPPALAAGLLRKSQLHAYVGGDPFATSAPPPHVAYVDSLGSFVVLSLRRPDFADPGARCAVAARIVKSLASAKTPFVFHPYPVTPYHEDYLLHADRVEAARKTIGDAAGPATPRIKATGALAEAARQAGLKVVDANADATLEAITPRPSTAPWAREGWFQAYQTYGDPGASLAPAGDLAARLVTGAYASPAERANLERRLVSLLTRDCTRVPVGYTLRHEPVSTEYSAGVENVGWDAQSGLASEVFIRTVKLKDFPWNGWLTLGTEARPRAAWNPVAGFGDDASRLVWAAVGDPAFLPAPYGAGVIENRVEPGEVTPGPLEISPDAVRPDVKTGALRPVGKGVKAAARVTYRVLASAFHDGTKMTAADILYPFVSAALSKGGDAALEGATAALRDEVAAVKVVRTSVEIKDLGDLQVFHDVVLVEVYLRQPVDQRHAAAVAPPWSPVPWELTVLMDEAVRRNVAAFSEAEARRRGVPWLDLVRDQKVKAALAGIAADFERRLFVPEGLRGLVTVDQARQRWAALRRFARNHGHWLVTNGPYRLARWTADTTVLAVFRDFSYPGAVGSFDRLALPLRAFPVAVERTGDILAVQADVETVEKFERSYKIVRRPFTPAPAGEKTMRPLAPVARYAVLAGDEVVRVGESHELSGERVIVDLKGLRAGDHRVLLALTLEKNFVSPEVRVIPFRVRD